MNGNFKLFLLQKFNLSGEEVCTHEPKPEMNKGLLQMGSSASILQRTSNCTEYFLNRVDAVAFDRGPSAFERSFPLAFALLAHSQPAIFEMFMASTFRPGDAVCVHIDLKADSDVVRVRINMEFFGFVHCKTV